MKTFQLVNEETCFNCLLATVVFKSRDKISKNRRRVKQPVITGMSANARKNKMLNE